MFASNQILKISGSLSEQEIADALEIALKIDDTTFERSKCVFQITENGTYCIGWKGESSRSEHWKEFPFEYDSHIIASIIKQHLSKYPADDFGFDGSYHAGFLMECIDWECCGDETIKDKMYGIVGFKPYTCFYSK